jgi:hypothetical protein
MGIGLIGAKMQLKTNVRSFNPFITNPNVLSLEIDYSSQTPKVKISGLPYSAISAVMREWELRGYNKDWLWDYCDTLRNLDYGI